MPKDYANPTTDAYALTRQPETEFQQALVLAEVYLEAALDCFFDLRAVTLDHLILGRIAAMVYNLNKSSNKLESARLFRPESDAFVGTQTGMLRVIKEEVLLHKVCPTGRIQRCADECPGCQALEVMMREAYTAVVEHGSNVEAEKCD